MMGYAGYTISKFFHSFKSLSFLLDRLETLTLHKDIYDLTVDKPIYITGVARAGTTIILEMLSKHPDLASHRYKHLLIPYIPHWFSQITKVTKFYTKPLERLHKDGIIVTRESPEAVEEIFWQEFFKNSHNEKVSNVIEKNVSNPRFERFYRTHIKKLIYNQNTSRYLAKNNYNLTRLEYLLEIIPSSKFLLIIRNPINHVASLIKQSLLFMKMERKRPLLHDWLSILGHHEFGNWQSCINTGNTDIIQEIRELWSSKTTFVKGWADYWNSLYKYIADKLDQNRKLKIATLIVRFEELCETPGKIIDEILYHSELPTRQFEKIKNYYIKHLHIPTYYTPNFSAEEREDIEKVTISTANQLGY
ncbi:MAG: sulfotransferase [Promethearchaeota archaeon]